jgi:predicted O-methyltransferase YrrM
MAGKQLLHWVGHAFGLAEARTQTTQAERDLLAQSAKGATCIVELGVYEGVTSRVLRAAMSPVGTLWCVDPFSRDRLGFSYGYGISRREVSQAPNGDVRFIRKFSHEAVQGWTLPIDLVFIDADHSYDAVRQDWENWSPFVRPGGAVAFHDSRHVPGRNEPHLGPIRLANELRLVQGVGFRVAAEVDTLTVFTRDCGP